MTKSIKLFLFGLTLWSFNQYAQGVFDHPDSLLLQGQTSMALIGYQKQIFDLEQGSITDAKSLDGTRIKQYRIYFQHQEYKKAYETLLTLSPSQTTLEHDELLYQKLLSSYLSGDFANTELEYRQYTNYSDSLIGIKRIVKIYLLSLNELHKWDEANKLIKGTDIYKVSQDTLRIDSLRQLYQRKPTMKQAKKAKLLNTFLPGAGYLYLGKKKDATVTAALQVTTLALSAGLVYYKLYLSAGLLGMGLYMKFRDGSINRSEKLCRERNALKGYEYNTLLRNLILKL